MSVETNPEWFEKFRDLESPNHEFHLVKDWDSLKLIDHGEWDVALVDHAPEERRNVEIRRLKDNTRFIVVHDADDPAYHYEETLPSFRYRFDYRRLRPGTTVVSDFEPFTV